MSFLDLDFSRIQDRKFRELGKSNLITSEEKVEQVEQEFDLQQISESLKQASKEHPYDKGLKYARAQILYFLKQTKTADADLINSIVENSKERFNESIIDEVASKQLAMLSKSAQIDEAFLLKVAKLVTSQSDYEAKLKQLGFDQNNPASIESRKFLCKKVNEHHEVVNNLTFEIEEHQEKSLPVIDRLMEQDSFIDTFSKLCKVVDKIGIDVVSDPKVFDIIDFKPFRISRKFGVRSPEYQVLNSLSDEDWKFYKKKMSSRNVVVEYNTHRDVFEVHSGNSKKAEEPKNPAEEGETVYKYSPELKAPPKVKKDVIHPLEGQAKEALTKIMNRTEKLREIKDQAAVIQAELTKAQNVLAEEKEAINEELENYLKFADAAFKKQELVLEAAYSLEAQKSVILAAIKAETREVPLDPTQKIVPITAQSVLDLLRKMGKVTDEMVTEAEKQIKEMNSAVRTVKNVTKTVYTWPPSKEDIKKMEGSKNAGLLDKFIGWAKGAVEDIKEFFRDSSKSANQFLSSYQELQVLLEQ